MFITALAILVMGTGAASPAPNLAAYRCAGAGTLTATFTAGPNPPSTAGYVWSLTATGACVASPDGPWVFTAQGRGYNGSCGFIPAATPTTLRPYSPLVVNYAMSNPRTGATRNLVNAWYLTGSAGAFVLAINSATPIPSCSSPSIGGLSGRGALVTGVDPTSPVTGASSVTGPAAFAVQFR